ncbi:cupin domain-containing protein [Reinekea marina]|uniref:Cupin domain-containing protein n=1 Tax=Reinekea marina TaxID=1310421 RepID=A0ABV7WQ17_9GAMM|nr:cupin domain-containing protein [Reinekea marina]MDN3648718.1 cupin domain-containing protein [Reinekea marina]
MPKSTKININEAFKGVTKLQGRTPHTSNEAFKSAYSVLSDYRDGGVFITHYDGFSEWEQHPMGDEFVQVIAGTTTIILLENDTEHRNTLAAGEMIVVPQGIWHRFESPEGVKVLTITPQPTEHSIEKPILA